MTRLAPIAAEWMEVSNDGSTVVERMQIYGGWIVKCMSYFPTALYFVFIPDPHYQWEIAQPEPELDSDLETATGFGGEVIIQ